MSKTIHSTSEAETERCGRELAAALRPGSVIALYGDLGVGKTAFVRGLAEGLGVGEPVSSPTFTIVNEYEGRLPLFHFDLYRLQSEQELFDIGWEDYLERGGVCVLEWSERAGAAIEPEFIRIHIRRLDETQRELRLEWGESA